MEIGFVVALAVVGAIVVARPLVRTVPAPHSDPRREELDARKRTALEALVDLESEHEVGKISDDDFAQLEATYQAEALAILDEIDALGAADEDDELESEIAAIRARLRRRGT